MISVSKTLEKRTERQPKGDHEVDRIVAQEVRQKGLKSKNYDVSCRITLILLMILILMILMKILLILLIITK